MRRSRQSRKPSVCSLAAAIAAITGFASLGALHSSGLRAQAAGPPTNGQAFEVATVKPNKSGDLRVSIFTPAQGGRFNATNVPLRDLIRVAFGMQSFQLVGGPDWIGSERFDIVAKAEGDVAPSPPGGPPGPMLMMLQTLLAERFKLAVHRETRDLPIYSLVMARTDRRPGPELHVSKVDCAALAAGRGRPPSGGPAGPPPPPPPPPLQPGERPPCGMYGGIGRIAAGGVTPAQLAMALSQRVNRIVVDRTGLAGLYEFELQFTPDQLPQGPPPPGAPPLPSIDPNGPSIFTALQEQLGLKLDSQKGPVDVLVIDHVEPPMPD